MSLLTSWLLNSISYSSFCSRCFLSRFSSFSFPPAENFFIMLFSQFIRLNWLFWFSSERKKADPRAKPSLVMNEF